MLSLKHIKRQYIIYISAKNVQIVSTKPELYQDCSNDTRIVQCTLYSYKCSTCHNVHCTVINVVHVTMYIVQL